MKKILYLIYTTVLVLSLSFTSYASEYVYTPENNNTADSEIEDMLKKLPDNIKDKIVIPSESNIGEIARSYDFVFFKDLIINVIKDQLPGYLNNLSVSIGILIIISLIRKILDSIDVSELKPAISMCTCFATSMILFSVHKNAIYAADFFLNLLSDTMIMIVPIMESIYIASGSFTLASVTSTALNIMIAFTESVFSKVLSPVLSVCFILSILSCATGNKAVAFMSKTIKGLTTGILVLIMSLMTMGLTLQINASSAADNFASRAVRFALGSYIPIVGGSISDSFSIFQSSLSTLKDAAGITGIVIVLIICFSPVITLIIAKLSSFVASNAAGMLECDSEKTLFEEIGGCYTLLLAIVLSSVIMYIIALSQLCKSTGAFV